MKLEVRYLAVIRERGPAWDPSLPMREQKQWKDHAAFMDALAEEGFVVLGGPWGEGEQRFLLVFNAESKETVEGSLGDDPWTRMGLLRIAEIDYWEILLQKGKTDSS